VLVVAQTDPRPALHGQGLVVLVALAGMLVGAVTLLFDRGARQLPSWAEFGLLAVLMASSFVLVCVEPNGAGFAGGALASAVAARLPGRVGATIALTFLALLAVASILGTHRPPLTIMLNELGAVALYRVGRDARRLHERTKESERLLAELEQTKQDQLRAAALAERQRLAREMHDVLAHSLAGLVVHLEATRLLATRDGAGPELSDTVERAHHLAHAGLGEARQAIGMLRGDALPGPEQLPTLAEKFQRDTTIPCRLVVAGAPATLDSQTRLTLYRVAQEALTNITKHATPQRVTIALNYQPHAAQLTIENINDHNRPDKPPHNDHGYGITGMRERAELLGGSLDATPTPTGFRVTLRVPT
jgi:signal transduction histidine kinase